MHTELNVMNIENIIARISKIEQVIVKWDHFININPKIEHINVIEDKSKIQNSTHLDE